MDSFISFFVDRWVFFVVFGILLLINLPMVPVHMSYLRDVRAERERIELETGRPFDVNEDHDRKSFERSQLELNMQVGLFFLSLWIASGILWYQDRKLKK